jgi:hypothetical protein
VPEDDGRNETPTQRADRNLSELLQELRVALPGVQVLFAFLLTVPFQQSFRDVTEFQRDVYFGTLLCSTLASALLMAPSAYHRLNFRRRDKTHIVETANKFMIAGLAVLAVAMTGAVTLVTDYLFGPVTVALTVAIAALGFATLWFVMPLARRRERDRGQKPEGPR